MSAVLCCLDLEGILVPEIWIKVSEKTKIRELRLTTRDVPDYDALMRRRLRVLRENKIKLKDIQNVIARIEPLPGAKNFLDRLRLKRQTVILSDTYYEFATPLMKKLGCPTLFCNWLSTDAAGYIARYHLRQPNGKAKAVKVLRKAGFRVLAVGDSYNDISMLKAADKGVLFNPPSKIAKQFPKFKKASSYAELLKALTS